MAFPFAGPPLGKELFTQSPFAPRFAEYVSQGAWSAWGRYALPEVFSDSAAEVLALRTAAIVEDKSPLTKYRVHGSDAERFIDRLITRNARNIETDHAYYTPWCDDEGKIIVECLVFRLSPTEFVLSANPMVQWFEEHRDGLDVAFDDITDNFGILALQGPRALDILEEVSGERWSDLRFSRGRAGRIGSAPVHGWRTGFTGVKGYELWVPPAAGADVWDALMQAGASKGLEACGHIAQDIVRVEAGLVLPDIDYGRAGPDAGVGAHGYGLRDPRYKASPFEIDLGRLVDFGKSDFVGKRALEREAGNPAGTRRMMGLEIDWRGLVRGCMENGVLPRFGDRVRRHPPLDLSLAGKEIGYATSVTWSDTMGGLIGFAHVPIASAQAGVVVTAHWPVAGRTFDAEARLRSLPFVKPSRT